MRELQAICKNMLLILVIKLGLHFKLHYHNAAYILRGFIMKNFDNMIYRKRKHELNKIIQTQKRHLVGCVTGVDLNLDAPFT